jgi:hypothetical protein
MRRPPPIEERPQRGSYRRKDTRRWCRGKQGVEHVWEEGDWLTFERVGHDIVYVLERCTRCRRHGKLRTERREHDST